LLDRGADVNYQDPSNLDTPTHRAIYQSQFETAKILILAGARSDITNANGKSPTAQLVRQIAGPRNWPAVSENKELIKLLEGDWQATGEMLHLRKNDPKWIQILLDHWAQANFRNSNGNTALHHAIQMKNYENAKV
jgi:ankyrin repeat protein